MKSPKKWTIALGAAAAALSLFAGCTKDSGGQSGGGSSMKVGLVTDVGGRGDKSFNDSALRGLENWAADKEYVSGGYKPLDAGKRAASIPGELADQKIVPLGVEPMVLHAKQQEDYESNLQLLVDNGASLSIGVGFMLENSVESAAKKNPGAHFVLVDSPILNASGETYELPNVATVTFREQEGAFLVGAIAGLVSETGKIGFVGGMQLPLIKRFEVGFRAGVHAVAPEAAKNMRVAYTGSFNRVDAGKQVAQDMFAKGVDIVFHAAGGDGLGVIAAAKEAGRMAIGCDSDQYDVAPDTVLTSLLKRVDLAVYQAAARAKEGVFKSGNVEMGLAENGLAFAPIRIARIPADKRDALLNKVKELEKQIVSGAIQVPATQEALDAFMASGTSQAPSAGAAAETAPQAP